MAVGIEYLRPDLLESLGSPLGELRAWWHILGEREIVDDQYGSGYASRI
jgi:hypothetical protein